MHVKAVTVVYLMVALLGESSAQNVGQTGILVNQGPPVHFFASMPTSLSGYVDHIKYTDVTLNIGGGYNKYSGVFTAPVSGVYQFFFSYQSGRGNENNALYLVVRGSEVMVSHSQIAAPSTASNLSTYMTVLKKGDVVYVYQKHGGIWAEPSSRTITFSGSLLSQIF
ncbi:complement C1q-like protein 4 [Megalops cyprinoides]|uniref:complement C1q-like protein 4 n=1 Tax=Megalops cyprinoides TaxID=118141 RepID=UPI00186415E0|nr:complement C1q-like protein 4 [Megalops cyprinoides]